MINEITLEGWIIKEPANYGKLNIFTMSFARNPKSEHENCHFMIVKTFDNDLVDGLKAKDKIVVSGRLQIGQTEQNGSKFKNIAILVDPSKENQFIQKVSAQEKQSSDLTETAKTAKKVFKGKEIKKEIVEQEEVPW